MISMITRVMMAVRDTTSITAMATENPTVGSLLACVPKPKKLDKYHYLTNSLVGIWLPCIVTTVGGN